MTNPVQKLGDKTSHSTVPDFEGGRGYYWMKQVYQARKNGATGNLPRKPRRTQAEKSFFAQVDRRLSRTTTTVNISFDENGRRIRE